MWLSSDSSPATPRPKPGLPVASFKIEKTHQIGRNTRERNDGETPTDQRQAEPCSEARAKRPDRPTGCVANESRAPLRSRAAGGSLEECNLKISALAARIESAWRNHQPAGTIATMTTSNVPTYQSLAARSRSAPGKVSGKLKLVLDRVVNEGADPYEAARAVGMHARSVRKALAKGHVLAYLRAARQVLRETARAQNIHHMIAMRAESSNEMARLGAMKLIEQEDGRSDAAGGVPTQPGLIICITGMPAGARLPPSPGVTIEQDPDPAPAED
jgi:hypothetical protein